MTGGASSVIGPKPGLKQGHANSYNTTIEAGDGDDCARFGDSMAWIEAKQFETRPNEYAKLVAEKTLWNEVLAANQRGAETYLSTLLPYFVIGSPLYKEAFNSSCRAIMSVLKNEQYGFPEVHLPTVDVEDLARAHVACVTDSGLLGRNSRHLIARDSLWWSEILDTLKKNTSEISPT